MFVDAHHHLWAKARGDYPWMDGAPEILQRDYLAADLAPLFGRFGIERSVLIQAAPTQEETDFLLNIAEETDFIAGVVGWLDMEDENFPERLAYYARKPKFVGVRPMLQDIADDDWILSPAVMRALREVAKHGLAFDVLIYPRHLPQIVKMLEQLPELRAVIDHLAKPPIAKGICASWRDGIEQVAAFKNVYCKISGMITEADPDGWTVDDLRPFVAHTVKMFGPERLIFGSDWPVCLTAGNYSDVLAATIAALPRELAHDRRIFGENAIRFYDLKHEVT
jgi:L-fuconolactonase